ncbi:VanZ family protein [Clostridium saccharoperbutylacetonicum]|uniref:VanZ family protein n=1 Tax=Clostridium saccharoperbutylacetonicum TaxID=36745 RepID=UPI0039E9A0C1
MKKISILLCILWMGFIFYMSSNNGQISHDQSTKVVSAIEDTKSKLQNQFENKTTNDKARIAEEYELDHIIRKNAHGFMYMILGVLVSNAFFIYNQRGKTSIIHIMFICLLYAVTDEFHQSFVPGRTSLVSDVLVDLAGAIIGMALFYIFYYMIYKEYLKNNKSGISV